MASEQKAAVLLEFVYNPALYQGTTSQAAEKLDKES
jgi:hypothetical protein